MRALLAFILLGANAFAAGPILFGARGGTSFTAGSNNGLVGGLGTAALSNSYLIGPTVGVRLPLGFSVEGDALYNRQTLSLGRLVGLPGIGTHADSWEFPAMLKFAFGNGAVAPVLGAGVTVRHINDFSGVPALITSSTSANSVGFVAAAGLRWQAGAVAITPEVRYTRWSNRTFTQSLLDAVLGSRDQAQVLVGVTF
jgi:hypothetical protein